MVDLGTNSLQVASQAGLGQQDIDLKKQQMVQNQLQQSGQDVKQMGQAAFQQQLDMVTITPQIAAGLKSVTGDDSWDRAVGTKWKSNVFSAITTAQSQAALKRQLEQMHDNFGMSKEEMRDAVAQAIAEGKNKATIKAAGIRAEGEKGAASIRTGGKGGTSNKDLQASKAVLHNAELRRKTLTDVLADDDAKKEAKDWLSSHAADIKKSEDAQSSMVPAQPAANQEPESEGTDKTVPLNQNLPGLE